MNLLTVWLAVYFFAAASTAMTAVMNIAFWLAVCLYGQISLKRIDIN